MAEDKSFQYRPKCSEPNCEQVASYKYPRVVEFRESLPIGPTGKILKRALKAG